MVNRSLKRTTSMEVDRQWNEQQMEETFERADEERAHVQAVLHPRSASSSSSSSTATSSTTKVMSAAQQRKKEYFRDLYLKKQRAALSGSTR
jgi:hypothetical protein